MCIAAGQNRVCSKADVTGKQRRLSLTADSQEKHHFGKFSSVNPVKSHENKWFLTCSELHKGKLALVVDVHVDDTRTYGGTEKWSDKGIIARSGKSKHYSE